jgi:hypothetical protein
LENLGEGITLLAMGLVCVIFNKNFSHGAIEFQAAFFNINIDEKWYRISLALIGLAGIIWGLIVLF